MQGKVQSMEGKGGGVFEERHNQFHLIIITSLKMPSSRSKTLIIPLYVLLDEMN